VASNYARFAAPLRSWRLQSGANAAVASGTVTEVNYSLSGQERSRSARPFALTFARQVRPGHWLITDTLESPP
jgi:hypothetical protein